MKSNVTSRWLVTCASAMVVTALAAACVTEADREAFRRSEMLLEAARERAYVTCKTPAACADAWNRARRFVELHSTTPVTRVTDATVETALPHEFGVAWFWVVRETPADDATTIRLKGMCRGMYATDGGPGWTYGACVTQIRNAEIDFPHVVGEVR